MSNVILSKPHLQLAFQHLSAKSGFIIPDEIVDPEFNAPIKFSAEFGKIFSPRTTEWINELLDDRYQPDWHVIEIDADKSPLIVEADNSILCAPSKTIALSYLLSLLQSTLCKISYVNHDDDSLTIYYADTLLASIRRIEFHSLIKTDQERATNALRGLRTLSPLKKYASKLKKIDGLQGLIVQEQIEGRGFLDPLHLTVDNLCSSLQELANAFLPDDCKMPLHASLEITAKLLGQTDWNRLSAFSRLRQPLIEPPHIIATELRQNGITVYENVIFVRGLDQGFLIFGKELRKRCNRTFNTRLSYGLIASTFSPSNFDHYSSITNALLDHAEDNSGLSLYCLMKAYASDEHVRLAKEMLHLNNIDDSIRKFTFNDLETEKRILAINGRLGIPPRDHLFINDWVYYVTSNDSDATLIAHKVTDDPREKDTRISELQGGAIVFRGPLFWLTDVRQQINQNRLLPTLDSQGAERIAEHFGISLCPLAASIDL